MHHIASDGWSSLRFGRDLARAYAARCCGAAPDWAALPVQYADYTLWQQALLEESGEAAYCRDRLAGLPDCIDLRTDRPRPAVASHRGAQVPLALDAALHGRLCALARAHNATLFMVLQAGLAILLNRLGAGCDIAVGFPIAGRTDHALDELVGFFVNTLVLRTDLSGRPAAACVIGRVRAAALGAYAHQELPFERPVELANPVRSTAHHPLFQVALALQNTKPETPDLPGLQLAAYPLDTGTAKFDLAVSLCEHHTLDAQPDGLAGSLEYATDLFDPATAHAIAHRLTRVLHAIAANPAQPISQIDILDPQEHTQILHAWNDTGAALPIRPQEVLLPPRTDEEEIVRALFAETLGIDEALLGVQTSFFEAGARGWRQSIGPGGRAGPACWCVRRI